MKTYCRRYISVLIYFTMCIFNVSGYNLTCPSPAHWKLRASSICKNTDNSFYTCLWNTILSENKEYCGYEEVSRFGYQYTLMPNPQQVSCSNDFYQPIKFTTLGNSRCIYQKSMCNDEGQVEASKGTDTTDRSCRCDYTKGYRFVVTPKNGCTCVPSLEDCSCYYNPCVKADETMYRDYICRSKEVLPETIPCEDIVSSLNEISLKSQSRPYQSENNQQPHKRMKTSLIAVTLVFSVLFLYTSIMSVLLILPRPFIDNYNVTSDSGILIRIENDRCQVLEGDIISLSINVDYLYRFKSVTWQNYQNKTGWTDIHATNNIEIDSKGTTKSLKIKEITKEFSGSYRCVMKRCTCTSDLNYLSYQKRRKLDFLQEFPVLNTNENEIIKLDVIHFMTHGSETRNQNSTVILEKRIDFDLENNKFKWIKKDSKLKILNDENTPSLIFKKCCKEDAGVYFCMVTGPKGRVIEKLCYRMELQVVKENNLSVISDGEKEDDVSYLVKYLHPHQLDAQWLQIAMEKFAKDPSRSDIWIKIGGDIYTYLKKEKNVAFRDSIIKGLNSLELSEKMATFKNNSDQPKTKCAAWDVILMMEQITLKGENICIYEHDVSDFMVLSGLIMSAKQKSTFEDYRHMFQILLSKFETKLTMLDRSLVSMMTSFDDKGNSFFHYIVLYGTTKASIILGVLKVCCEEKYVEFQNIKNNASQTPLELAAFLGNSTCFNILISMANNVDTIGLHDIVKLGEKKTHNVGFTGMTTFGIDKSFERRVTKTVIYGTKDEYFETLKVLAVYDRKQHKRKK